MTVIEILQHSKQKVDETSNELLVNLARLALIKEGIAKEEALKLVKNITEAERVIATRKD